MSIDLRIEGSCQTDADRVLEKIHRLVEKMSAQEPAPHSEALMDDGVPTLLIQLHPAAEPLRITAPAGRQIVAEIRTGTCGPGFHHFVCKLLVSFEKEIESLSWQRPEDAPEVLEPNLHTLQQDAIRWVQDQCRQVLDLVKEGGQGFSINLPVGTIFQHDGVIATPLGPRSEAWLKEAVKNAEVAKDIFPWWESDVDANFFRGIALTLMWTEVRWRQPLMQREVQLMHRIVHCLEKAHGIDSEGDYPWHEWSEIFSFLSEDSLRSTRVQMRAANRPVAKPIGYRRQHVRVFLSGGWSLMLPGDMAEDWDDRSTYSAWNKERSFFFNSHTFQGEGQAQVSSKDTLNALPELFGDDVLEFENEKLLALAAFVKETEPAEGKPALRIDAHGASGPHAAVATYCMRDEEDSDWALESWASLLQQDDIERT